MEELSLALISVTDLDVQDHFTTYAYHQTLGIEHLSATVQFLQSENREDEFRTLNEVLDM